VLGLWGGRGRGRGGGEVVREYQAGALAVEGAQAHGAHGEVVGEEMDGEEGEEGEPGQERRGEVGDDEGSGEHAEEGDDGFLGGVFLRDREHVVDLFEIDGAMMEST